MIELKIEDIIELRVILPLNSRLPRSNVLFSLLMISINPQKSVTLEGITNRNCSIV